MTWSAHDTMSHTDSTDIEYRSAALTLTSLALNVGALEELPEILEMVGYPTSAK